MVLLLGLPLLFIAHPPMQDLPDWTLQSTILNHLDDPGFAPYYSLRIAPVPNSLATLFMTGAGRFIGEGHAGQIAAFLTLMLFTFGFVYLRRADGRLTPHIEIIGLLLSANVFFMMGYLNFCLGIALMFYAVGYYRRRAPHFAAESAVVLGVLMVLIYFAHFLAFFAAFVALGAITWRTHYKNYRQYFAPAATLVLPFGFLVWYAIARKSAFVIKYDFSPLTWAHNLIEPFLPLVNFYPLTPPMAAWSTLAINALVFAALVALCIYLIMNKTVDIKSPLIIAAGALAALGLLAPARLFELVFPGQRLIFIAFFFFLADINPTRALRKEVRIRTYYVLILILAIASLNFAMAGKRVDVLVTLMDKSMPAEAKLLLLNDSHFALPDDRTFAEKLKDPYSYPARVNAVKEIAYYYVAKNGGLIGYLFPSGQIRVTKNRPPAVNTLDQLADEKRVAPYTHIIATGRQDAIRIFNETAAHSFRPMTVRSHFAIMEFYHPQKIDWDMDFFFIPGL